MIQNGVEYDLAFLRPLSWIEATGAEVGGSIHMELHEMGLDGLANVVGVDACPQIEADDGTGRNVVTGTMAHAGANILYLDITGLDEPLGVTDTHPIWSETRQDFVKAGQLEVGGQFRTLTGESATLTKIHPHRGPPELVFNLEVDGEHVYSVAGNGLLVHNDCLDFANDLTAAMPDGVKFRMDPNKTAWIGELPNYPVPGQPQSMMDKPFFTFKMGFCGILRTQTACPSMTGSNSLARTTVWHQMKFSIGSDLLLKYEQLYPNRRLAGIHNSARREASYGCWPASGSAWYGLSACSDADFAKEQPAFCRCIN
ncbi:MAG: polymorphic toxin-type HINT domain-containing protein [Fuerstiella sp.]